MAKKNMIILSSLLILPSTFSVLCCSTTKPQRKVVHDYNSNNNGLAVNKLKNNEEVKLITTEIGKIKNFLKKGIDGSDFTPSQSLADINVQRKIIEKLKKLCKNPENITFEPQLKSQYFKAGNENYVDVNIVYTKKDVQYNDIYKQLQIKNIKQDLEELVNNAAQDLTKETIDCTKSFLLTNDGLQYKEIEEELLNILWNNIEQDDERLKIEIVDKNQWLSNTKTVKVKVIGKNDIDEKIQVIDVKLNLITVEEYIKSFVTNISFERTGLYKYQLFASKIYFYRKEDLNKRLQNIFKDLNEDQLNNKKREFSQFKVESMVDSIHFGKGNNNCYVKIAFKFNNVSKYILLNLTDIEKHPEDILEEVENYFKINGIDLANIPIFKDDKFESDIIRSSIVKIMQTQKAKLDEKDDINIEIKSFLDLSTGKEYLVKFKHKNPEIIGKSEMKRSEWFELRNLETSPTQDLNQFMIELGFNSMYKQTIKIPEELFNNLASYDENDDLNEKDKNLMACLNTELRAKLNFSTKLKSIPRALKGLEIKSIIKMSETNPITNEINAKVKFTFDKLSRSANSVQEIIFEKE